MTTTEQIALASFVVSVANAGLWFYTIRRDAYRLKASCNVYIPNDLGADARCLELKIRNRGTRPAKVNGIVMLHGKDKVTHAIVKPNVSVVCRAVDPENNRFEAESVAVDGKNVSIVDLVAGRIEIPSIIINPGETFTKKYLPSDQDEFVWSENGIGASDLWIEDALERRYHLKGAKKALREYFMME